MGKGTVAYMGKGGRKFHPVQEMQSFKSMGTYRFQAFFRFELKKGGFHKTPFSDFPYITGEMEITYGGICQCFCIQFRIGQRIFFIFRIFGNMNDFRILFSFFIAYIGNRRKQLA